MSKIRFDVLTLFPEMFQGFLHTSLVKKALEQNLIDIQLINFRDFSTDKHHMVDDAPYGGGDGMVLKPEPIFRAVNHLIRDLPEKPPVILMSPQGEPFSQAKAEKLASYVHLVLICGHYAGFDERVHQHLVTEEISIGDFVLTGGELPAMTIMDSVSRHVPGFLGNENSVYADSFSDGLLEYPQYTRPANYQGYEVPDVLLSGHHQKIDEWRRKQSLLRTWLRRPDLLQSAKLSDQDKVTLAQISSMKRAKE